MRGKIDRDGFLHIERKGAGFKSVWCPFGDFKCGDWCVHFGEPYKLKSKNIWVLETCKTLLYFKELKDEREGG